ncbi:MAG: ROK family protein [Anaerolineae bacterium]|nr:ROK family protein [Anaerolineae bacterium]
MPSGDLVVGVDVGGTSLFAAVVDTCNGKVLGKAKRKTKAEQGANGVVRRIVKTIRESIQEADLDIKNLRGIGVGVPGPLDPEKGVVFRCVNLGESWTNFPLVEALQEYLPLPVVIENDVNAGAVGEHTYGAGRGSRDMLAIFVGTGIGGGLIIDGKLYPGVRHSAAEVGHMVILADGPLCSCGARGHAEALASRSAIERDIRNALERGADSIVPRLLRKYKRTSITSRIIGEAYESGDKVTREAVRRAQYYLGLLVASCVNLLDPEMIVIGGGLLERMGEEYLVPVRRVFREHQVNKNSPFQPRVVRAELGDFSGAMGAAVIAQRRLAQI